MNTDTSSIHQENKPGDSIYIPGKSQASINVRVSEVVQRGYRFKYDSSSGEYSDVLSSTDEEVNCHKCCLFTQPCLTYSFSTQELAETKEPEEEMDIESDQEHATTADNMDIESDQERVNYDRTR